MRLPCIAHIFDTPGLAQSQHCHPLPNARCLRQWRVLLLNLHGPLLFRFARSLWRFRCLHASRNAPNIISIGLYWEDARDIHHSRRPPRIACEVQRRPDWQYVGPPCLQFLHCPGRAGRRMGSNQTSWNKLLMQKDLFSKYFVQNEGGTNVFASSLKLKAIARLFCTV